MAISNWSTLEPILQWLGLLSLGTFAISLAVIPLLIARLPRDFFIRHLGAVKHLSWRSGPMPLLGFVLRNLAGGILLLAGVAMLFLPGQGILTIVLGLSLMAFPGKHRLLSSLTTRPSVQQGLDWIRLKTGHQAFLWPGQNPEKPTSPV